MLHLDIRHLPLVHDCSRNFDFFCNMKTENEDCHLLQLPSLCYKASSGMASSTIFFCFIRTVKPEIFQVAFQLLKLIAHCEDQISLMFHPQFTYIIFNIHIHIGRILFLLFLTFFKAVFAVR